MSEIYDREYFEDGIKTGKSGYENYRWLPERIYREVRAVIHLLGIEPGQSVLDIGSAKGFWVKGFRHYNIEAYGFDTSEYALSHADNEVKRYLVDYLPNQKFDYIVSRNTFEHIKEDELKEIFKKCLKMTDVMFFTVPLIDPKTGDYIMQVLDTTHEIKWSNEQWIRFCEDCGWKNVRIMFQLPGIHDKYNEYPNSIGFYVLKK